MRLLAITTLFAVLLLGSARAETASWYVETTYDQDPPPVITPLAFSTIPSLPGTASANIFELIGLVPFTNVWADTTPIFTVPTEVTLTVNPTFSFDQYADLSYIAPYFVLNGISQVGESTYYCNGLQNNCNPALEPQAETFTFELPAGEQFSFAEGTVTISAVPETATWEMLLIGFAAIGFTTTGLRSRRAISN